MSENIEKSTSEKVKILSCVIASVLMSSVIILNIIIAIKAYILKHEIPDIGGVFPLISLTDDAAPSIRKGDLIFCTKKEKKDIFPEDAVAYYIDNNRTKIGVSTVGKIEDGTVTLILPDNKSVQEVCYDRIIGKCGFKIPILGYIIYFMSTIPGFLLCVVLPTVLITEIYLYRRRKAEALEGDEESILLARIEALKEERKILLESKSEEPVQQDKQDKASSRAAVKKKKRGINSRPGVRANAKRMSKFRRKKKK